ncbi:catalase [Natrialba magadii ATCC 43099]|uniref:Catalase n=1 Tax=Natrialba magadii (strain ATCC 43099 / DSM 3394 / CCM 3739 / CIP 104546 / IAM 13178 / JCM 8861 / NBRC 102185 / NCIMB 2190 / MS3) TaxID=547559 RepID=L9VDF8_NATMM|nr:catalase [Natrialba magadii ATCC 43099]
MQCLLGHRHRESDTIILPDHQQPFSGGYSVASRNLAGNLYANVIAKVTGRTLTTQRCAYNTPGDE